jgi:hypothetical protein
MQLKTELIYSFINPMITAASGLVLWNDHFYCVSDDELSLIKLHKSLSSHHELIRLFPGDLPEAKKERKRLKPDLEAVVFLPAHSSLLCLPSGSKSNRVRGAIVNSKNQVQEVRFDHVYDELSKDFSELNVEGALVKDERITLIQRGNGEHHQNALIELDLNSFLRDEVTNKTIFHQDLALLNGTPLSFTDGTTYREKTFYLAVAEKTESTYEDGEFAGAVLGCIGGASFQLDIPSKPEGLAIQNDMFYLVTDDDDRTKPSKLYRGFLPPLFIN